MSFNHQRWENLRQRQLGVEVIDPVGHDIGPSAAGRYEPVDGRKHVLVGEFDHYGFFDPIWSQSESDFNIHISPNEPYRFLLDQVANAPNFDKSELSKRQRGQGFCVEAEVTPGGRIFGDEFFPTSEPYDSPLIGKTIGVYGPWVHDNGHPGSGPKGRPEIHPCEFIWWDDSSPSLPTARFERWFLLLQDASARFWDPDNHFDGPIEFPWAGSPRRINFSVALQPFAGMHNEYDLQILSSREVRNQSNAGNQLVLGTVHGEDEWTVMAYKVTGNPSEMRISLSEVVADPTDSRFRRCFLLIRIAVGNDSVPGSGYALLRLLTQEPNPFP